MDFDVLVVGAGISGITVARSLADKGLKVIIVEKRRHIGGNCHDGYNEHGILIHTYGPHIFHTRYRHVWLFLSKFTRWRLYQHRVLAFVGGRFVPFPISPLTLEALYGGNFSTEKFLKFLEDKKVKVEEIRNSRDVIVSQVGEELYQLFFKNYTKKQWGVYPEDLLPEVCARIPIRHNRDPRYFEDPWQGIPLEGYTSMFNRMLDHPNISVLLGFDYLQNRELFKVKATVYTGPMDAYFDYCYGKLGYRKVRFEFQTIFEEEYQPAAVVNYPNDYDFTRITEYKKLTGQEHPYTTVSFEYPGNEGVDCYPIPSESNERIKSKYEQLIEEEERRNVFFLGRLGRYRYINMDQAVHEALELAVRVSERLL